MNIFLTVVLCALWSLAGILVLTVCLGSLKAVWNGFKAMWQAVPVLWEVLCDVKWKYCLGHSALGFVVSILVAPSLPVYLATAAGVVSTALVSLTMRKLQGFELSQPEPIPAPAAVQFRRRSRRR